VGNEFDAGFLKAQPEGSAHGSRVQFSVAVADVLERSSAYLLEKPLEQRYGGVLSVGTPHLPKGTYGGTSRGLESSRRIVNGIDRCST